MPFQTMWFYELTVRVLQSLDAKPQKPPQLPNARFNQAFVRFNLLVCS